MTASEWAAKLQIGMGPLLHDEAMEIVADLEAAEVELDLVDTALARRQALDDCQTRYDKIIRACSVASRVEKAEAERKVAWDRMAVHNKDADDTIARAEAESAGLREKLSNLHGNYDQISKEAGDYHAKYCEQLQLRQDDGLEASIKCNDLEKKIDELKAGLKSAGKDVWQAQADRDKAEAERDDIQAEWNRWVQINSTWIADRAALAAALRKYGRHKKDCLWHEGMPDIDTPQRCTCGFEEVLRAHPSLPADVAELLARREG